MAVLAHDLSIRNVDPEVTTVRGYHDELVVIHVCLEP